MKAIVTIPPYAPFLQELAEHPIVEGFRLNTVMDLKRTEPIEKLLERLQTIAGEKPVWIDLKCRQLRVAAGQYFNVPKEQIVLKINGENGEETIILDPSNPKAYGAIRTPPWAAIELSHEIELDTTKPVRCYFSDGIDTAFIAKIDGNRLLMLDGPERPVGFGESINIMHPSLKIKGYLTELDKQYIKAGKSAQVNTFMLSYVEQEQDITDVLELSPTAQIVAKIESEKGLKFIDESYAKFKGLRLMAARGDLYIEVERPHKILNATRKIVRADKDAIAASRIFGSLRNRWMPECQDITDVGLLIEQGYKRVMIGDDICFKKHSVFSALDLLEEISKDYQSDKTVI